MNEAVNPFSLWGRIGTLATSTVGILIFAGWLPHHIPPSGGSPSGARVTIATIIGSLLLTCAVSSSLITLMYAAFILVGLDYGGVTPTNSNFVRHYYGTTNYAMNLSLVSFNLLISVFMGQYVGSMLYVRTGAYPMTSAAMTALGIIGMVCATMIKVP